MRHHTDTATFHLSKDACRAVLAFAGNDRTRETLYCVRFDPPQGAIYATDGHALVRARNCGRSAGMAYSVPRPALEQAVRMLRRGSDELLVSRDGNEAVLEARNDRAEPLGSLRAVVPKAEFPPVEQVFPAVPVEHPVSAIGFDASLLARVELVQRAAGATTCKLMLGYDDLSPAVVETNDRYDATTWTAVIMPCRL